MALKYLGTRSATHTERSYKLTIPKDLVADIWKKEEVLRTSPLEASPELPVPISFMQEDHKVWIEPTDILLSDKSFPDELISKADAGYAKWLLKWYGSAYRRLLKGKASGKIGPDAFRRKLTVLSRIQEELVRRHGKASLDRTLPLTDLRDLRQLLDAARIQEKVDREEYLSSVLSDIKDVRQQVEYSRETLRDLEAGLGAKRISQDEYSEMKAIHDDELTRLNDFCKEAVAILSA